MRRSIISIGMVAIGALFFSCSAFGITVNGDMGDWGVTPASYYGGASDWTPNSGIYSIVEDQMGGIGTWVGPGYGGQQFDAEAMYYKYENSTIYLAVVTGMRVEGRVAYGTRYYAGDIGIDFNGDGVFEYAIKTIGADKGKLYKNLTTSSWNKGLWGNQSDPTYLKNGAGEFVGDTSFYYGLVYYNPSDYTNDHSVIEIGIPQNYFGTDYMHNGKFHWTQNCGNDVLDLFAPGVTPEPASLSLIGLGLFGMAARIRKRRKA